MPNLELRHLRAFVAVAEELHFTRAAERLNFGQQALSSQIKQLEDELDTTLFVRTTRKVELTDAGVTLLSHAKSLLGAVEAAWANTQQAGRGELGSLLIAYTPTVAAEVLPRITDELRVRFPGVQLRGYETWQADAVSAVTTRRLDVGFVRSPGPFGELASAIVAYEPLGIVLGSHDPLTRHSALDIDSLSAEALMIWPRDLSPDYYELVTGFFRAHGFTGPIREFEILNRDVFFGDPIARTEMAACRAFSVAFGPEQLPSGFLWRPLTTPPQIPVSIFWHPNSDSVTVNFVEMVKEVAARRDWLVQAPSGGSHGAVEPDSN
jgi:DNA-binding transcriptional LysR family regulator